LRSAYRTNKNILIEKAQTNNEHLNLMFIYNGKYKSDYSEIEKAMISLLKKF